MKASHLVKHNIKVEIYILYYEYYKKDLKGNKKKISELQRIITLL